MYEANRSPDNGRCGTRSRSLNCISEGTIRDYRVLDLANLIVSDVGRHLYNVVFSYTVFGLRLSWEIGFTSFGSIAPNQGMGLEDNCVRSIFLLDVDEE